MIIPVGSTEQHGPHLPLDTDTRIATAVARHVAARLAGGSGDSQLQWVVAPAIAYGASGEHQSFPGTISIGTDALSSLLLEYGRSATCWAQRLVFVNGHGGNIDGAAPARSACCGPRDVTPGGARARWPAPTPTPATPKLQYCCIFRRPRC